MNEKVNTFIMFGNQKEYVDLMTDAQAGQLLKALYAYNSGEDVSLADPMVQMAFLMFKQAIENGRARREQLKANGSKGGRPKTNENQNETKPNQNITKENQTGTNQEANTKQTKAYLDLDLDLINLKQNTSYSCQNPSDFDGKNVENSGQEGDVQQGELIPHGDKKPLLCPQQKIVEIYHECLPELPRIKTIREDLQKNVRTRWQEKCHEKGFTTEEEGLEYFRHFFEYVSGNKFLMGRIDDHGWRCDYRWLMKAANFDKVTSGFYERWQA